MYTTEANKILEISDITALFEAGCKPRAEHKIGVEYERLPVKNKTFDYVFTLSDGKNYTPNQVYSLIK